MSKHAGHLCGNPSSLAVAGDSAGANLAAVVALKAREARGLQATPNILVRPVGMTHRDCFLGWLHNRAFALNCGNTPDSDNYGYCSYGHHVELTC